MASELERVRECIREAEEFARTYVFEMTDDYRALIERVEALPRNQPGADKSGRWIGSRPDAVRQLRRVQRAPRT